MKVCVMGAGAWGTALAQLVSAAGHSVTLWGHNAEHLAEMQRSRRNETYLPGIDLPLDWIYQTDLARAIAGSDLVVVAIPSRVFRDVTRFLADFTGVAVSVTKGIEFGTGLTMSGVLAQTAPKARHAALSGPTLALEVARSVPTACVTASADEATARQVQQVFHRPTFRVYTSTDILGVELGGALKNVIAIAAGVGDGMGFGDNSKASLITRGIAEMQRLGVAAGAQPETFAGLSGLGDLAVTCFSKLSRNRGFGERIGRGENPEALVQSLKSVAEGYPTAKSAHQLARRLGVYSPIVDETYALLYEGKRPKQALMDLINRDSKAER